MNRELTLYYSPNKELSFYGINSHTKKIFSNNDNVIFCEVIFDNKIQLKNDKELYILSAEYINYEKLNMVSLTENSRKLKLIKNLKYNWNGYGAGPIKKSICVSVEKLINKLIVQPKIFPTANNSIQLEYYDRKNLDNYLIFDINENGINLFNSVKKENLTFNYSDYDNINEINSMIEVFYGINQQ